MVPQSTGAHPAAAAQQRRPENLALAFQELITVIERLRSSRQAVSDAATFRHQIREAIKAADLEARKRGYTAEDIQYAIFAVVAFLDESILNLRNPIFGDWPRQPLQEELFGHHIAGEVFFQNLQKLLGRSDSHEAADVIEVYYLCLLLGFAGKYSLGGRGELRAIMDACGEKIKRIRGSSSDLSPFWRIPAGTGKIAAADPWTKRLLIGSISCVGLTLLLFLMYKFSLLSGISTLRTIATQGRI
jgi:type VI secretion system protein ImpK